jgi:replicative DNA helicase
MQVAETEFDRLPPHSTDAEEALLGAIAIDAQAFADVRPMLRGDSFFSADNQILYRTLAELYAAGKKVDMVLLRETLSVRGLLEEIGGTTYLMRILGGVPVVAYARHYAEIVVEKARLRELIAAANDVIRRCYAPMPEQGAEKIAAGLEAAAVSVREHGFVDSTRTLEEIIHEVISGKLNKVERRISTGLDELDELCGGLPLGRLTYVAGRAGMGKSQLCKQIVLNCAKRGVPCGIIAIEETGEKIAENYLANQSGIENNRIVYNNMGEVEWTAVMDAVPGLAPLPIVIDDAQRRLSSIETVVRRMVRKHKCRMIVVDHLHLIDGETEAAREQEITKISGGLKLLWKQLNVAGLVAAQVNRGGGSEHESPPELWHLRGSGSLEQDGDLILQLHRPDYYRWKKEQNFKPDHKLTVYVNKNKDGAVGSREFYFNGDRQSIESWNGGQGTTGLVINESPY